MKDSTATDIIRCVFVWHSDRACAPHLSCDDDNRVHSCLSPVRSLNLRQETSSSCPSNFVRMPQPSCPFLYHSVITPFASPIARSHPSGENSEQVIMAPAFFEPTRREIGMSSESDANDTNVSRNYCKETQELSSNCLSRLPDIELIKLIKSICIISVSRCN